MIIAMQSAWNFVLTHSTAILSYGLNLVIQSTIIILVGLSAHFFMREKHSVFHSLLLRFCLVAVLISPVVSLYFDFSGIAGFKLPSANIGGAVTSDPGGVPPDATSVQPKINHYQATTGIHSINALNPEAPPVSSGNVRLPSGTHVSETSSSVSDASSGIGFPRKTTVRPSLFSKRKLAFIYCGIIMAWLGLSVYYLVKTVVSYYVMFMIRRTAHKTKGSLYVTCVAVARELGIEPPPVLQSSHVNNVCLAGFFHPTIFIPLNNREDVIGTREVFYHELVHLARRDNLWNHLSNLLTILLPFQPLIWVLINRIRLISDYVCDDFVVMYCGNHHEYAAQIYRIASIFHGTFETTAGVGLVSRTFPLSRRIRRILDTTVPRVLYSPTRDIILTAFLYTCVLVVTGFTGFRTDVIHRRSNQRPKWLAESVTIKGYHSEPLYQMTLHGYLSSGNHPEKEKFQQDSPQKAPDGMHDNPFVSTIDVMTESMAFNSFGSDTPQFSSHTNRKRERFFDVVDHEELRSLEGMLREEKMFFDDDAVFSGEKKEFDSYVDVAAIDMGQDTPGFNGFDTCLPVSSLSGATTSENGLIALDIDAEYYFDTTGLSETESEKLSALYGSLQRDKMYPVWSPDGKMIAFNDKDFGIWTVKADGGEPRLVYDNYFKLVYHKYNLHHGDLQTLDFSPDGKEVAFRCYEIDADWGTRVILNEIPNVMDYEIENPKPVIESVDIVTGECRTIAEGAVSGCWSNDGGYFAYISEDAESHRKVLIKNLVTDSLQEIDCFDPVLLRFSNDDSRLFVTTGEPDRPEYIVSYTLQDGKRENVHLPENTLLFDVSPDGSWLLCSDAGSYSRQYLYHIQTGAVRDIGFSDIQKSIWGRFSPDGSKICFNFTKAHGQDAEWNIYIYENEMPHAAVDISTTIPESFSIRGNYPNPFNMSTTIVFFIAEGGNTDLIIYNSMGQKVRKLVSEWMEPGIHNVVWDGLNDRGEKVSTGVYLSRLTASGSTVTNKMMVVK